LQRTTIFRIMSMTKPIACVGLMMLYEEGHFLLDQPVSRFLPYFKKMVVKAKRGLTEPAKREITIRDCLTHTAGLSFIEWGKIQNRFHQGPPQSPLVPSRAGHPINQLAQEGTLAETVELLAKVPLNSHPGAEWEYKMILNGGILDGARILGRKTIELMTTNHTGDLNIYVKGPGYGYGLGFFVRQSLSASPLIGTLGAYGWGGAYCTSYFADPKEDLFGLQFTQIWEAALNPDLVIRVDFERMVYQALVGN
jgi:CubicO group peptidase (beta-lactamase class C family)